MANASGFADGGTMIHIGKENIETLSFGGKKPLVIAYLP
jgi:hypothetical protein